MKYCSIIIGYLDLVTKMEDVMEFADDVSFNTSHPGGKSARDAPDSCELLHKITRCEN